MNINLLYLYSSKRRRKEKNVFHLHLFIVKKIIIFLVFVDCHSSSLL